MREESKMIAAAAQHLTDAARTLVNAVAGWQEESVRQTNVLEQILNAVSNKQAKGGPKGKPGSSGSGFDGSSGLGLKQLGEGLTSFAKGAIEFTKAKKAVPGIMAFIRDVGKATAEVDTSALSTVAMSLGILGSSVISFATDVAMATPLIILAYPAAFMLPGIVNKVVEGLTSVKDGIANTAKELATSAASIFKVVGWLALAAPLMLLALPVALVLPFILNKVAAAMSGVGVQAEQINAGAEAAANMGLAVFGFAGAMALAGLMLSPAAVLATLGTLGAIWLTGKVLSSIGKEEKDVRKGASATLWMGLSVLAMGVSLGLTTLIVGGDIANYALTALTTAAAIGLLAYTFALVGKASKLIIDGARTMLVGGIGIAAVGLALYSFQAAGVTPEMAFGVAAVVVGLGLALDTVGSMEASVVDGALGLMAGGIAIGFVALGVAAFDYLGITMATALTAAGAVAAVTGALILAGLGSIPIAAGAIALALASVAMVTLAGGLFVLDLVYKKANAGLLAPSQQDPSQSNLKYMIGGIVNAFSINLIDSVLMLAGAAALVGVSVAMLTMAGGLLAFNSAYGKLTTSGLFSPVADHGTGLSWIVSGVVDAFSINLIDSALMLAGAVGLVAVSVSMLTMTAGLLAFNYAYGKLAEGGMFSPAGEYPTGLASMVGGIVDAFSINLIDSALMLAGAVGLVAVSVAMLTMTAGLLAFNYAYGKVAETGLFVRSGGPSPFEMTMDSIVSGFLLSPMRLLGLYASAPAWLMAGASLVTLGAGLSKFVEIVEKNVDVARVGGAIKTVLTSVADAIIDVYNRGVDWDEVEDGLDAIGEVGNVVAGLAEGVAKMADLKFPVYGEGGKITGYFGVGDAQFQKVTDNMKLLLSAVAGTLTEIGRTQGETGWFSKSAAEKGRDAIQGIGGDLVGIADFVQKAANLTFTDPVTGVTTTLSAADLAEGGRVSNNIKSMLTAVGSALGSIGKGDAAGFWPWSDSALEKGKQAVMGVAGDLTAITQMVSTLAGIQDFSAVETKIKRSIQVVPEAIMAAADFIQQNQAVLTGTAQTLSGLVQGPINSVVDVLTRVVEKNITEATGKALGSSIASMVAGFAGLNPDANAYNGLWTMGAFIDKLVNAEQPISKLSTSLEKINKSFSGFAATFKNMSNETLKNTDLLVRTLVDFSKVQPGAFSEVEAAAERLVSFVYERAEQPAMSYQPSSPATYQQPQSQQTQMQTVTPVVKAAGPMADPQKPQNGQDFSALAAAMAANSKDIAGMKTTLQEILTTLSGTLKVQSI